MCIERLKRDYAHEIRHPDIQGRSQEQELRLHQEGQAEQGVNEAFHHLCLLPKAALPSKVLAAV